MKNRNLLNNYIIAVSIIIFFIGVIFIWLSSFNNSLISLITTNVGSAFISAGILSFSWNLIATRWIHEEEKENIKNIYDILEKKMESTQENFLRSHYELEQGSAKFGLKKILLHRMSSEQVRFALSNAKNFTLGCLIDSDWKDRYFDHLVDFLKKGGEFIAYIPNPKKEELMNELNLLFGRDVLPEVKSLFTSLLDAYKEASLESNNINFKMYLFSKKIAYSSYIFKFENSLENFGMIRMYGNKIKRGNTLPAIMFSCDGLIYKFIIQDLTKENTYSEEYKIQ